MRKDIDSQVRSSPNLLPPEVTPYLELNKQKDLPDEPVIGLFGFDFSENDTSNLSIIQSIKYYKINWREDCEVCNYGKSMQEFNAGYDRNGQA